MNNRRIFFTRKQCVLFRTNFQYGDYVKIVMTKTQQVTSTYSFTPTCVSMKTKEAVFTYGSLFRLRLM